MSETHRRFEDEPRGDEPQAPAGWDELVERTRLPSDGDRPEPPARHPVRGDGGSDRTDGPGRTPRVAAGVADLVTILSVCTAALLAAREADLTALPWAGALGVLWWVAASSVTLRVRSATPGMIMAGLRFATSPPGRRVPAALLAGLVGAGTFGLVGLAGRRWPLSVAAGETAVANDVTPSDA